MNPSFFDHIDWLKRQKIKSRKMTNLKGKVAVVFAGSGEISQAVVRSFAEHGALLCVSARKSEALQSLVEEVEGIKGTIQTARVNAMDENEIDQFLQRVVQDHGKIDIVFNGIGASYEEMGGRPATTEASFEHFMAPIEKICGSQFLTSRVAAKYMIKTQSPGTILLLTAALSRSKLPNVAGISAASAAVEALTRVMAAEWGGHGIKVIGVCPGALMETKRISGWIESIARQYGVPQEQIIAQYKAFDLLKESPTLKQVGETAAFLASDAGVIFNSHIVDVDCGKMNIL